MRYRAEVISDTADVTHWEQKEYFDLF
jgi:hypothetical protein